MKSPNLFKKLAATAVITPLAITGLGVMTASPAAAHHPLVDITATCDTSDGLWDLAVKATSDAPNRGKYWQLNSATAGYSLPTGKANRRLESNSFNGSKANVGPGTYSVSVTAAWFLNMTTDTVNAGPVSGSDSVTTGNTCHKKIPIPAQPSYQDPCGLDNASWNVPADTADLDWVLEPDGDLVVYTKGNAVFTDGTTSKNFGKAPDSGVKCTVPLPPTPTSQDPCGPNNATWNVPADDANYDWTLRPDGHLIVEPKNNQTFPDGSTMKDYGVAPESNVACPPPPSYNCPPGTTWVDSDHDGVVDQGECVMPVRGAVQKSDKCESNNFFLAEKVKGAHYTLFGKAVREGVWLETNRAKIVLKLVPDNDNYVVKGKKRFVVKYPNDRDCNPVVVPPPAGG